MPLWWRRTPRSNRAFAGIDFETTSEEEFAQILADIRQRVEPLYEEIEATTPDHLADVVARRLEVGRQALETGEEDDSPEAQADERVLDEFALSECDVQSHEVTMTDYAFGGVPDEVDAGVTAFDLTNGGDEDHEFGIYLVPEGATESPAELLAGEPALERVGGTELPAGGSVTTFVDLAAGRYVVACLLPVDPDNHDSPTHASQGMLTEVVVA